MAANSKREQIILNVISNLEDIASITTVSRTRPFFNDMGQLDLDSTNLPLVAVVGKLPVPDGKISSQIASGYAYFTSNLKIELTVYASATSNPDSVVSDLMDDIWTKLYSDIDQNGVAFMTDLQPETETTLMHPYVIFNIDMNISYQHGIDSI